MTRLLQHVVSAPSAQRAEEIAALGPWFHNLHLPDGSRTAPEHPLGDFPAFKWAQIAPRLPEDLAGWTALDVGCNAGFYSFALAARGATVTGVDVEPLFLRQAEWAAREFGLASRVSFRQGSVYDLAHEDESYDLVFFMGLLYHLRYPLLGLDIVSRKVRRLMVCQTITTPGQQVVDDHGEDRDIMDRDFLLAPGWPKLAFIEHSFVGDPTNWWVPNHAAVEAMLRASGMRVIGRPADETYLCEPQPDEDEARRAARDRECDDATGRRRGAHGR